MGITPPKDQTCYFTDLPASYIPGDRDAIEYSIEFDENYLVFALHNELWSRESKVLQNNKWIFKGLILNHKWPLREDELITEEILEKIAKEAYVPRTPKEKLDNLLLALHDITPHIGQEVEFPEDFHAFVAKLFFKDLEEYSFYINTLYNKKLITGTVTSGSRSHDFHLSYIELTFEGLNHIIDIQESGKKSNRCFVAMSYSSEARPIREAIREVCMQLGFQTILVDETHHNSDQTINDAIIAEIKKSKFCIADFTEQKDGVYFEAGYALGRELKVIFTCHKDWWKKSHFDTNHFPHIVYENIDELKIRLRTKIEAWIL